MKTVPIDALCSDMDATIRFINALRQDWRKNKRFTCLGKPKQQHILVFFHTCTALLRTADGRETKIEENGIMYAPQGAQYTLDMQPQGETGCTVGVNFLLCDGAREAVALTDDVTVFPACGALWQWFDEMARIGVAAPLAAFRSRILLQTVLYELARRTAAPAVPSVIRPGVTYLQEHYTEPLTVAGLANLCHVSQVYFRRLFKETFGVSPAAYITRLRLETAANYLEHGDMTVGEIAEAVGYTAVSYFGKEFKKAYGKTPLHYRTR